MGRVRRRAYANETYWARPVPSFGDARARLLLVGLAPAAHGAHRTGRMFTGDRSGEWLFRALHRFQFASAPVSSHREDGLVLHDSWLTAAVRCAPPDNRPLPEEFDACREFLGEEIRRLSNLRVILALGALAFDAVLRTLSAQGVPLPRPRPRFAHGSRHELGPFLLLGSYHPSQRNTQTGFLTEPMFDSVFASARQFLDATLPGAPSDRS